MTPLPPPASPAYLAAVSACALADHFDRGWIAISGPDAAPFLHGYVTNDVKGLAPDSWCPAALLSLKGKMIADTRIRRTGDRLILDFEPGRLDDVFPHLDKYTIGAKVDLKDVSTELTLVSLLGPLAAAVLAKAAGDPAPLPAPGLLTAARIAGADVLLATPALHAASGCDIVLPRVDAAAVRTVLLAAGAVPIDPPTLEILRVEAGIPRYGFDMDGDTLPLEARLERAISYTKGCYLGQEVIARVSHQGHVNRKLTGLLLDAGPLPARGTRLLAGDKDVGWITTAVDSPRDGRPIALAYVRIEQLEPGTRLSVAGGGEAMVGGLG